MFVVDFDLHVCCVFRCVFADVCLLLISCVLFLDALRVCLFIRYLFAFDLYCLFVICSMCSFVCCC